MLSSGLAGGFYARLHCGSICATMQLPVEPCSFGFNGLSFSMRPVDGEKRTRTETSMTDTHNSMAHEKHVPQDKPVTHSRAGHTAAHHSSSGHHAAAAGAPHHHTNSPHAHAHHAAAAEKHEPKVTAAAEETVFNMLLPEIQRAVAEEGYVRPTPIQTQSIPHLLEGRDLLGCAQTGTGKTAAFTLPILQFLAKNRGPLSRGRPRVLILAPTRELAAQVGDSIRVYGRFLHLAHTVIFGGVNQRPQESALARGVDIVVATPGRLLDLMQQGFVKLDNVGIFVLDEADRMLDMGFIPDIRRIIAKLPQKRQSLFFSATLEPAVMSLANTLVHNPVHVRITPEKPTIDKIEQKVLFVDRADKTSLLIEILTRDGMDKVLVFVQMKHAVDRVCQKLIDAGITAIAIHGGKTQGARTSALAGFKDGKVRVLVATDIAARGLDVEGITHVINYHLPREAETYIHRIGRTARAGADGTQSHSAALRSVNSCALLSEC
jgi:ATP-dependent RNA helicase RhlE